MHILKLLSEPSTICMIASYICIFELCNEGSVSYTEDASHIQYVFLVCHEPLTFHVIFFYVKNYFAHQLFSSAFHCTSTVVIFGHWCLTAVYTAFGAYFLSYFLKSRHKYCYVKSKTNATENKPKV